MCACVLLSLLEAVTNTPMRAAALLSTEPEVSKFERYLDHTFEKVSDAYRKILEKTLHWKYIVVLSSLAFFVLSLVLIAKVRQEFVPLQDQDYIMLMAQARPGTSLNATSDSALKIEEIIKKNPNIKNYLVSIGGGGGGITTVNAVAIPIILKPRAERAMGHIAIMEQLRKEFKVLKDIKITMRDNSARNLSSGRQNAIGINLRGPDLSILDQKSKELIAKLEEEKLGVDLDTDFKKGIPELILKPNREAMAERGVSVEQVGQILSSGIGSVRQGRFTMDAKRRDIRFKIRDDLIKSAEDFKTLYVRNNVGLLVPLSEIVTIEEGKAIQGISRINRQRSISVFGNLAPGVSQAKALDRAKSIAGKILPTGYSFALEGASAGFASSFKSLGSALAVGILVAFLILAVQFDSFIHPFPVLIALPFSVSGALVALWMFGVSVNLFSFIGLIVLMGISKKNSIMLVEFSNQVREHTKKSALDALLEACPIRLRPILMTSVATVAAATPLIFGHGIGIETRVPMGLAIIGGTIVSTILTLFVVPALYLIMVPLEKKQKQLRQAKIKV
jgi:multidrug efflux pump subunit AcrB